MSERYGTLAQVCDRPNEHIDKSDFTNLESKGQPVLKTVCVKYAPFCCENDATRILNKLKRCKPTWTLKINLKLEKYILYLSAFLTLSHGGLLLNNIQ